MGKYFYFKNKPEILFCVVLYFTIGKPKERQEALIRAKLEKQNAKSLDPHKYSSKVTTLGSEGLILMRFCSHGDPTRLGLGRCPLCNNNGCPFLLRFFVIVSRSYDFLPLSPTMCGGEKKKKKKKQTNKQAKQKSVSVCLSLSVCVYIYIYFEAVMMFWGCKSQSLHGGREEDPVVDGSTRMCRWKLTFLSLSMRRPVVGGRSGAVSLSLSRFVWENGESEPSILSRCADVFRQKIRKWEGEDPVAWRVDPVCSAWKMTLLSFSRSATGDRSQPLVTGVKYSTKHLFSIC